MWKVIGALLTLAIGVVLVVVAWPQLLGLQDAWLVAQAVSLRGVLLVGAVAAAVVLLIVGLAARPIRSFALSVTALLVLFSAVNGAVMVERGLGGSGLGDDAEGSITVMSWNTLGDAPGAEEIARVAVESGADVVMLPETTEDTGVAVAVAMREAGSPMWVHTVAYGTYAKARSTTILISPDLGEYHQVSSNEDRADNTNVLPSVVLAPVSGDGPTFVAVHAVSPMRSQMENWRDDLEWLADQCSGENVIMAGDFNATVDHMAGLGTGGADLGSCYDAAKQTGDAAVGTWHTGYPALLGAPIDHVMATANWTATGMTVDEGEDEAGSDHRPIVVRLAPA